MDITSPTPKNYCIINGYGKGYFTINGQKNYNDIIICRQNYIVFSEKNLQDFIKKYKPELLLIGNIQIQLQNISIPYEIMSNSAACRTYNLLITEDRNVIAILQRH